jgi:probable F420-dependent oxidoreductase
MSMELGRVGIWWSGLWPRDDGELRDVLGQLVVCGYDTLWTSGGFDNGLSPVFERLVRANDRIRVASGIHSIWATPPSDTASGVARLESEHPGRFLLGLGVSHAPLVEHLGQRYEQPYRHMVSYLDALDSARPAVPPARRVLAALGPRMMTLGAQRSAGAHPYFVPVEHTEWAREHIGPEPMLAPEVAVVLETDAERAREMARSYMQLYLGLPNYTGNLRRFGYGDEDLGSGGSDRLVDAIVGWGDEADVAARVRAHLDAGASHVCVQVLNGGGSGFPLAEYQVLASALFT